jgi:hypothetical protein
MSIVTQQFKWKHYYGYGGLVYIGRDFKINGPVVRESLKSSNVVRSAIAIVAENEYRLDVCYRVADCNQQLCLEF